MCTFVNILSDKENTLASHTESTMLVSHLVDGDVFSAVLTSCKEHGSHDKQSHVSHNGNLLSVNT